MNENQGSQDGQKGRPARPQQCEEAHDALNKACHVCERRRDSEAAVSCENEAGGLFTILSARIIHECRREAFETEARRGFSHVRPTQAYLQSVEEAEREKLRRAIGSDDGAGIHE